MFSILRRVTGVDLLEDISEFFQAFSGMVGGFQERAKRVNELLGDRHTAFLVVCGPQGEPIEEAVYFHRKLVEAKLPFEGVVVNKVHFESEYEVAPDEDVVGELMEALGDEDPRRAPPQASPTTGPWRGATVATSSGFGPSSARGP